jgi:hypothetical protein
MFCAVTSLAILPPRHGKRRSPGLLGKRNGGSGPPVQPVQKITIVLDAGGLFDWIIFIMKTKIFAALVGIALVATGCVSTVTDTHTAAMVPFGRDSVEGRYQRTVDQVYQASVQVIQHNGVVITEFIPHDTTNTVRSLLGKVNQCDVWLRVEAVDPQITQVAVQARTKWGNSNIDLAHEMEKEIALQLAR